MFLSNSAFGVVASSSPQIVVIDQGRPCTLEVNENDQQFSCNQSLQTYSDLQLSFSIRNRNKHEFIEHNGFSPENAAMIGCKSRGNNLVLETKNSAEDTASDLSEIKITNVRSLATNQLATETNSSQDETSGKKIGVVNVETIPDLNYDLDIKRPKMSDDQSNLNNGHRKPRKCPYSLTIRASPSSIHGLRKIRPRPSSLNEAVVTCADLSRKNKDKANSTHEKYSLPLKQFRSSKRTLVKNNDELGSISQKQTNAVQGCNQKRNPIFILSSSHPRFNPVISGVQTTPSLESTNKPQLQKSSALELGMTQTLRLNSAPNSSPQNDADRIFPSSTLPANMENFTSKPLLQDQNRRKSACLRIITKCSTEKNGRDKPLTDELLNDLAVVRVHRRPYFQCKESRELVEVRPRDLTDDSPTLLAHRDLSGRILVDWTANSNYRAAEKIKKLMQSNPERTCQQDQESGLAHKTSSTNTAQCPCDVTSLVANEVVYTISDHQ